MERSIQVRNVRLGEGRPKICVPIVGRTEEGAFVLSGGSG